MRNLDGLDDLNDPSVDDLSVAVEEGDHKQLTMRSWPSRMGTGSLAGNTMRSVMMFLIRSLTTFPTFMSPGPMLITSSLPRENWKLMKGFSMKVSTTAPKQGNCGKINRSAVKRSHQKKKQREHRRREITKQEQDLTKIHGQLCLLIIVQILKKKLSIAKYLNMA